MAATDFAVTDPAPVEAACMVLESHLTCRTNRVCPKKAMTVRAQDRANAHRSVMFAAVAACELDCTVRTFEVNRNPGLGVAVAVKLPRFTLHVGCLGS